jgi:hypothetical protein
MTPESRNSSLLGNGSKQAPAEMYTCTIVDELPFLCNGKVNASVTIEELLGNGGVEYLHRSPASRRGRRKRNPVPGG